MPKTTHMILAMATGIALLSVSSVGSAAQFDFFVPVDVSNTHPALETLVVLCRLMNEAGEEVGIGSTRIPMDRTDSYQERVVVGVDVRPGGSPAEVHNYSCTLYITGGGLEGMHLFEEDPGALAFQRVLAGTELVHVVKGLSSAEAPRVKTGFLRATGLGTPPPSGYAFVVPTAIYDAHPEISSFSVLCRLYGSGARSNSNQRGAGSTQVAMPREGRFVASVSVVAKVSVGQDPGQVGQYDCTLYIKNEAVRGITTFTDNPKAETYRRTDPESRLVSVVSGALNREASPLTTGRLQAKGLVPRTTTRSKR